MQEFVVNVQYKTKLYEKLIVFGNHQPFRKMPIIKQLLINRLPLPEVILGEIKGYCFYDVKTAAIMKQQKKCMKRLLKTFENAYESRVNDFVKKTNSRATALAKTMSESEKEYWRFISTDWKIIEHNHNIRIGKNTVDNIIPTFGSTLIHGINCRYCGKYKQFFSYGRWIIKKGWVGIEPSEQYLKRVECTCL